MALLIFYLLLALGVSFLCSMTESGVLSLSRSRIAVLVKANRPSGHMLMRMRENIERPLAAILTLNTIAHTIGAAGVGAQALKLWGQQWVALTSVVLTVLILVLSEIIPKTLGVVYRDRLAVFTAYCVHIMTLLSYPLVVALQAISRMLSGTHEARLTREEFALIAEVGQVEGALHEGEYRVIHNLLRLKRIRVSEIMTPRTVVFMLQQDMTVRQALDEFGPLQFARIPLYGRDHDDVTGFVLRHDLHEAAREGHEEDPVSKFVQPIHAVPEAASIERVLAEFIARREQIFLAVEEHGGTAGIVTLEDAIETLLGEEIVDETDVVTDMRDLAGRLFESKLRGRRF